MSLTPDSLHALIVSSIRQHGPMTVAAFMDLALYHPDYGYYATRDQRSGQRGDFYTSVDVGPFFGELLAEQFAEMAVVFPGTFDLVEAAAGNGRLMRDVLDALQRDAPGVYARVRVCLVERSALARAALPGALGPHASRLSSIAPDLPSSFEGILFANELLDAFPVHVVVMREGGPREIVVDADGDSLVERDGPLAGPEIRDEIDAGPPLSVGMRTEINLAARSWIREAERRLVRGFVLLIDYGDTAQALRSPERPDGTLRAFSRHQVSGRWLEAPGAQDLTSHVDFTALERWARDAGLAPLGRTDQSRFLIGLGAVERLEKAVAELSPVAALRRRLALKTLLVPGGMGSTHTVIVFGKDVGEPGARGQTPFLRFR